jgi:hypothetical protein
MSTHRFDTNHPLDFSLAAALGSDTPTVEALEAFAPRVSLLARRSLMGAEAQTMLGLHELLAYGLRGVAAYAHHAEVGCQGWDCEGIGAGLTAYLPHTQLHPSSSPLPLTLSSPLHPLNTRCWARLMPPSITCWRRCVACGG